MSNILAVTGITGHTGGFFLRELINHKYEGIIRCLVRTTSNTTALDNSGLKIEKVVGNISDESTLKELLHGADAVMHIVNIRHSIPVLKMATAEGVERAVFIHTTGIYSKFRTASDEYKEIEAEMHRLLKNSTIDVTIIRPTMIYGDMCDHNIHKFIKMVDKLPIMPEIDRGSGRIRPVNARDLGKASYQVMTRSDLPELSYDVSGEKSLTLHELFEMIGAYLGKNTHFLSVPMWFGIFCAKALKTVTLGKKDMVEKVLRMGEDRDYDHDAATRDFGYQPESFDVGLKREVEQYKAVNK